MSDVDNDDIQKTREDNRLTTELYMYILQTLSKKSYVRASDIKKIYSKTTAKDQTIYYRTLPRILKEVEQRLWNYMRWKLTITEDKITMVNMLDMPPTEPSGADESHRLNGILRAALMYIFMAKNPNAKNPEVSAEDLLQFMEKVCAKNVDGKLNGTEMDHLKKLIAPNSKSYFVKKGWISFTKSTNENDEEVFRYDWGPVAKQSIDPAKLVELYQSQTDQPIRSLSSQIARAVDLKELQVISADTGIAPSFKGRSQK